MYESMIEHSRSEHTIRSILCQWERKHNFKTSLIQNFSNTEYKNPVVSKELRCCDFAGTSQSPGGPTPRNERSSKMAVVTVLRPKNSWGQNFDRDRCLELHLLAVQLEWHADQCHADAIIGGKKRKRKIDGDKRFKL